MRSLSSSVRKYHWEWNSLRRFSSQPWPDGRCTLSGLFSRYPIHAVGWKWGGRYALVKPLIPSSLCHVITFSSILTHREGSQVRKERRVIDSTSPSLLPYCQLKGQQSRTQVVRGFLSFRAYVDIVFCFIVLTPYCELSIIDCTIRVSTIGGSWL